MADQRQPLSTGYTQEFELIGATTASLDLSARLAAAWSGESSGHELDQILSRLGDAYLEEGRVRWDPPSDLDLVFADYLSRSVDELNRRLAEGTLVIREGEIRPAATGATRGVTPSSGWRR